MIEPCSSVCLSNYFGISVVNLAVIKSAEQVSEQKITTRAVAQMELPL